MFRSTDREKKPSLNSIQFFVERRASVAAGDRSMDYEEMPPSINTVQSVIIALSFKI